MKIDELIAVPSDPAAYPHPTGSVEARQTHISVVFLAGPYAYKAKKPIDLDFLHYGTLARRRRFCESEGALNRRLAPVAGSIKVDVPGEAIEWAVKRTGSQWRALP